jgi:L-threonylcarbamoyladenylate synthase
MQAVAGELNASGKRVGVLVVDEDQPYFDQYELALLGSQNDLAQVAHHLFSALRCLDEQGVDVILARLLDPAGLGATINDRLLRAAEGHVIHVGE